MTKTHHLAFPLRLESGIPPLALTLMTAALMGLVSWLVPALHFTLPANAVWAAGLVLAGALACLAGVRSFRSARTTVNPLRPEAASTLVDTGIYRYSRNPMYLGFALILLGWALLLAHALAFLWLPAFVAYLDRFQIAPEERALLSRFGPHYRVYEANVPRWL